jgi:5-methylcytosine-specific restriction endonuclease McrA
VARTKLVPHPKAPTIDCIVPLSASGSPGYVQSNTQLACFMCNSLKNNRGGGEQLRLIG